MTAVRMYARYGVLMLLLGLHSNGYRIKRPAMFYTHRFQSDSDKCEFEAACDVAIIGAGIGGLSCAAVLSALYRQKVHVYESHCHIGGCAHTFPIKSAKSNAIYKFDSGPTVILGCSNPPFNPLMQILRAVGGGNLLQWIQYDRWGMVTEKGKWDFELGPGKFECGPLSRFGGPNAISEFQALREACAPLCAGAAGIPTMALRGDRFRLIPLLRHIEALKAVIPYSGTLNGEFEPLLTAHVKDPWLKAWLDALAFSLSGMNASMTGAATMAYTLYDLHRPGAALDYPAGGFGAIGEAFRTIIEQTGSKVFTSSTVADIVIERGKVHGIKLRNGQFVKTKRGVVCNSNVWALPNLLQNQLAKLTPPQYKSLIEDNNIIIKTKSFTHLHLGIDSTGLDLDSLRPHYTVMDKGLFDRIPYGDSVERGVTLGGLDETYSRADSGGDITEEAGTPHSRADPCGDRNMVAVSNPSVLDSSLVNQPNKLMLHAYGAGNEPFGTWGRLDYSSPAYKAEKENSSQFLYRSTARALGITQQELKDRIDVELVGTPLTHRRFLLRHEGTYGATFKTMLNGPSTAIPGLYLAGDSVFPGIGVPAVAVSGANAANTMVSIARHMLHLMESGN